MSYFTYQKRKTTIKSILVMLGLTTFAFALMASPAFADPEKKMEDKTEMAGEQTEQIEDAVKDKMDAPAKPMELPETPAPTVDAPIETDPTNTPSEIVPEVATEDPVVKQPAEFSTPILGATIPTLDKAQSCYKQESGTYECICEGDKDCAELTSSDICETGTTWRNPEGFGGCTKKAE